MGEYIGIRFGRVDTESGQVDWIYKPHDKFDGIGGFGAILRDHDVSLEYLPQKIYPPQNHSAALVKALPQLLSPPKVLAWSKEVRTTAAPHEQTVNAPQAVAWHVFSEEQTKDIIRASSTKNVTVNSLLLRHLTAAIRPALNDPESSVPWMVPVNLRGKVVQEGDTGNHSSYVAVAVDSEDSVQKIHREIYEKIRRGEHWANWKAYELTRSLPHRIKKHLIETNRAMIQWNIGSFSNLGVWDPDKKIQDSFCSVPWVFAPPVLRCQLIGAGCITFQGQLGIMLQSHPALTVSEQFAAEWVSSWVEQIKLDMRGISTT